MLMSIEEFWSKYRSIDHKCKDSFTCKICQLKKLIDGFQRQKDPIDIIVFKSVFTRENKDFFGFKQQDCHEFLLYFLNQLQKEDKNQIMFSKLFEIESLQIQQCSTCNKVY